MKLGYTLTELLNLTLDEYSQLPADLQSQINKKLASVANARVKRAIKQGYAKKSPAIAGRIEGKRGKNRLAPFKASHGKKETASQHYADLKTFLKTKTSTKKGQRAFASKMEKVLGGRFRSKRMANSFWSMYNKWLETKKGKSMVTHGKGGNSTEIVAEFFKVKGDLAKRTKKGTPTYLSEEDEARIFAKLNEIAEGVNDGKEQEKGERFIDI